MLVNMTDKEMECSVNCDFQVNYNNIEKVQAVKLLFIPHLI